MLTQDYTQKVYRDAKAQGININELLEQMADLYFLNIGRSEVTSGKTVDNQSVKNKGEQIIKNYA